MCTICLRTKCELGLGAPQVGLEDLDALAPHAANTLSIEAGTPPGTANWKALDMGVNWFDYGLKASDPVITYTVTDSAADYGSGSYAYNEPDDYIDLSDAGEAIVREAFELWDAAIAVDLEDPTTNRTTKDDDIVPAIRAGGSGVPSTAWAYGPGAYDESGDIWFGADQSFLGRLVSGPGKYLGSYEYATSMHEMGHALGLKHPHQGSSKLDTAYDGLEYTVMSYRSHIGGSTGGYTVKDGSYPQSLMMLDIAMAQAHYGADYRTFAGDTVYRFDAATGAMSINGMKQGEPVANKVFRTLWDGGGTDLIDLSNYATDLEIDLRPGRGIDLDTGGFRQRALLDRLDDIYAPRHIYMSLLHEGDTRSLIENAKGGSGADIFIGNAAANVFRGGAGADAFTGGAGNDVFALGAGADTVTDTLAGLDGDRITDLAGAEDRIVVTGVKLAAAALAYDNATGLLDIDADGNGRREARLDVGSGLGAVAVSVAKGDSTITFSGNAKAAPATLSFGFVSDGPSGSGTWRDADGSGDLTAGDTLGYSYTLTNTGGAALTDVTLVDSVATRLSAAALSGLTDADGDGAADDLAAGATATAARSYTVKKGDAGAVLSATATAGADEVAAQRITRTETVEQNTGAGSRLEAGTVRVAQDDPDQWHTVTFAETIADARVVMGPPSSRGGDPSVMRVRNVTETGFEFQIDEWDYLDGGHLAETVSWVAGSAGTHSLASGQTVAFGRLEAAHDTPEAVALSGFDAAPAVFAQITSRNGHQAVTDRIDAVSARGFSVRMQEEEANDQRHMRETLDWMAIDYATDGAIDAQRTRGVSDGVSIVGFDAQADDFAFLADMQTEHGRDTAALRTTARSADRVGLFLEEEASADAEIRHADEAVAYLTLAEGSYDLFA